MSTDTAARPPSYTAFGLKAEAEPLAPGLHIVATPIGNLRDISFRALATLAAADAILAEDTRTSKTLLAHYGISTPLLPYHEHNAAQMRPKVLAKLREGGKLALISDAGTPLVSDPGYKLVAELVAEGLPVTGIPGPSAVLAALVLAGLPTDRFFFEGFLPPKSGGRRTRLTELAAIPGTLVFFESPRRLAEMLTDAAAVLGARSGAVARELTKFYETVRRGTLPELAAHYESEEEARGEIVVIIGPPGAADLVTSDEAIDERLRAAMAKVSLKEAVAQVAAETGQPRRKVYARALELTRDDP
ncbi:MULTISPECIES: 16S rRNA (cytidine(1402)-2'-O)-methyltransferase [Bosea]|uniref:16S rRNA (cytidine(1402)-2'-O)-methyltransferase n=1 Tax=Bosea TaxID=85413 RepID=UPI0021505107|nr:MULTISPECIES: 16S rRNA (cytidine(1402)-2'-O)-methyltransferase [Bosea]MCR4522019.1 16S rRNA (cytidine(1402)-2'-O)-methyltransferase [Bosea sp. 47.2.35]MDR6829503.1 16S rRNA (cytidine1402-2'-O)-methyltransferase [Bosea robiniae]MDR6896386.1 16S rRNA (cytidine1402-2'-O)-methyltransferase [Bosea sp. BE109]MDR7139784.1 16S rRNA (cytidine1402-2'-O)-methyltransferase [Bosea sp. BE168]MDR7176494.1 16S rRNA (cytidine1402-2'-O)-methyltransferase [Bosea sp. BE271]